MGETGGYSWEEKISQFLSNLLFPTQVLVKDTFAADSIIASLEVSDGPDDSPVGLPGLADLLFYSWSYIWSHILSNAGQTPPTVT